MGRCARLGARGSLYIGKTVCDVSKPILIGIGVGAFAGLVIFGDLVVGAIVGGSLAAGYALIKGRQ